MVIGSYVVLILRVTMKNKSVAVLMSVYCKEKPEFLQEAMESLWTKQTLKPDQVVLVQDGPLGDVLLEVIVRWKRMMGAALVLVVNEENIGLTKSLNKGLAYVDTEYIARMDSDDVCVPSRFQRQVDFLEKNKDVDVVGTFMREIDEYGELHQVREYPTSPNEVSSYIKKASPLQHASVMFRKSMFDDGIKYNERYRTTQDLALWFDVLASGRKIANIPDILMYYRLTNDTYDRRDISKGVLETKIYIRGIYKLHGFTLAYVYPIARLVFRLLPKKVTKLIYNGKLRTLFLNKGRQ